MGINNLTFVQGAMFDREELAGLIGCDIEKDECSIGNLVIDNLQYNLVLFGIPHDVVEKMERGRESTGLVIVGLPVVEVSMDGYNTVSLTLFEQIESRLAETKVTFESELDRLRTNHPCPPWGNGGLLVETLATRSKLYSVCNNCHGCD